MPYNENSNKVKFLLNFKKIFSEFIVSQIYLFKKIKKPKNSEYLKK